MLDYFFYFGIFYVILRAIKGVWKLSILKAYHKVPYEDHKKISKERYFMNQTIDNEGTNLPADYTQPTKIVGATFRLVDRKAPNEKQEKSESMITETVNNDLETQQSVNTPSFPKDNANLKMIPKLDFSWHPLSDSKEINRLTSKEWGTLSQLDNEKTLFESIPTMDEPNELEKEEAIPNHLFTNIDEVPNMLPADYFIHQEDNWHSEKNATEVMDFNTMIEQLSSAPNNLPTENIKSMNNEKENSNIKQCTVKVIGEEGDFLHVEESSGRKWVEINSTLSKDTFSRGTWYSIRLENREDSHFPLILAAQPLDIPISMDFVIGDDLVPAEWEEEGLAVYQN